jgi:hypothetical protein
MALNGSTASGRCVRAELVIDPIGIVFGPLEHSPARRAAVWLRWSSVRSVRWSCKTST